MARPPKGLRLLSQRHQFVSAARGQRAGRSVFSLQALGVDSEIPGVGITVTKKVGTATERNRVKRRLRAAIKACAQDFKARHDYVLVGRREALHAPFATLTTDLSSLVTKVHSNRTTPSRDRR